IATAAPASAKASAVALPMPREPPVTKALFPASSFADAASPAASYVGTFSTVATAHIIDLQRVLVLGLITPPNSVPTSLNLDQVRRGGNPRDSGVPARKDRSTGQGFALAPEGGAKQVAMNLSENLATSP